MSTKFDDVEHTTLDIVKSHSDALLAQFLIELLYSKKELGNDYEISHIKK